MTKRLGTATVSELKTHIRLPAYQPGDHGVGIVHLGVGAFHKAHQAVYTDDVLARHGGNWRIRGVSLRSQSVAQSLNPQQGLFSVGVSEGDDESIRIIGSIAEVLVAPDSPEAVLDALSDPGTHCITLTITEKGYCVDPSTGKLDMQHPQVVHDLGSPRSPHSAPGYLCEAIRRRALINAPVNIISCDNLAGNGQKLKSAVMSLLQEQSPQWIAWCEHNVAFPSTMVDRIVPAVTDDVVASTALSLGLEDRACVKTEPFSQWVIEDRFIAPRPAWEDAGALIVRDVEVYETNKLRLLNGAHSFLAYVGLLRGHTYVHEAIADPELKRAVEWLMDSEVIPELTPPAGFNLHDYAAALRARFANTALNHALLQIAADGSQKLPQRLLPVIRQRIQKELPIDMLALGVAAWIQVISAEGLRGESIIVDDPIAERMRTVTRGETPINKVALLLDTSGIFGDDLATSDVFSRALLAATDTLIANGALV